MTMTLGLWGKMCKIMMAAGMEHWLGASHGCERANAWARNTFRTSWPRVIEKERKHRDGFQFITAHKLPKMKKNFGPICLSLFRTLYWFYKWWFQPYFTVQYWRGFLDRIFQNCFHIFHTTYLYNEWPAYSMNKTENAFLKGFIKNLSKLAPCGQTNKSPFLNDLRLASLYGKARAERFS